MSTSGQVVQYFQWVSWKQFVKTFPTIYHKPHYSQIWQITGIEIHILARILEQKIIGGLLISVPCAATSLKKAFKSTKINVLNLLI